MRTAEMFVKILSFHLHVYLILTSKFLKSILLDPGPNVFLLKYADENISKHNIREAMSRWLFQRSRSKVKVINIPSVSERRV